MKSMFPERLKETRLAQGFTQKQLAEMSRMALASYSSYEKGAKRPPLDAALRIAQALNVSLDWLCGNSSSKSVHKFETYADVIQAFLKLDTTGLDISIGKDEVPIDTDEARSDSAIESSYRELYESYDRKGIDPPVGIYPMSSRAIFRISNQWFADFFKKWSSIRRQARSFTIDYELYTLWCEKQITDAAKIPLPFASE